MKRISMVGIGLLTIWNCTAQTPWVLPGNATTSPTSDFVGTTDNNQLVFRTDNLFRFRVNATETYPTLGGFSSLPANGFTLISPDNTFLGIAPGPYSLLHLAAADNTAQQGSYRDWMKTGITFTGNADQGYVGQKAGELDYTDLVLHWSDNPTKYLKDRLRMIFTSGYDPMATSGASSREGLEGMRLFPVDNDHVNVGLGDFYAGNLAFPLTVIEPTERLDILNGKLRIRQLPTDAIASTLTKFLVVDDTPGPDFGVVKWRNVPPGTGAGCEWALAGGPGTDSNVLTAYNGSLACPQGNRRVGIGTGNPGGKLAVTSNVSEGGPDYGLVVNVNNLGTGWSVGALSTVSPASGSSSAYQDGVRGVALNATWYNTGTRGQAFINNAIQCNQNTGVFGDATVSSSGTVNANRGGYFGAKGTNNVANNYGSFNYSNGGIHACGVYAEAYTTDQGTDGTGVSALASGMAPLIIGAKGVAKSSSNASFSEAKGVYANGKDALKNYGMHANAQGGLTNYGVYSKAYGNSASSTNYGIWAQANGGAGSVNWAVWSQGSQFSTTAGIWSTSDESLKTNIEDMVGGLEVIMQLTPKTYMFRTEEYPDLQFSTELQNGLIAQEMQDVVPNLVRNVQIPEEVDSLGNEVHPALDILAVKYEGLIPLLISAVQEQQATIEQLRDQINQCCATNGSGMTPRHGEQRTTSAENNVQEQRLLIIPNPVADLTTLEYYVPKGGKVSLQVSASDGKPLATLREEIAETGAYRYSWNTTNLAAGTYFCTFMLDGAVVVKRAVKVK